MNLGKLIRAGYRMLSILNTANVVASGNPTRIARHIVRRQLVRKAGTFGTRRHSKVSGKWGNW